MRVRLALVSLLAACPAAAKEGNCMARILSDVAAEEAPEQVKSKSNGEFGPVTIIKVYRQTGKMVFCSGHSYCYNSNAFELVTPCRIKRDSTMTDDKFFYFFTR